MGWTRPRSEDPLDLSSVEAHSQQHAGSRQRSLGYRTMDSYPGTGARGHARVSHPQTRPASLSAGHPLPLGGNRRPGLCASRAARAGPGWGRGWAEPESRPGTSPGRRFCLSCCESVCPHDERPGGERCCRPLLRPPYSLHLLDAPPGRRGRAEGRGTGSRTSSTAGKEAASGTARATASGGGGIRRRHARRGSSAAPFSPGGGVALGSRGERLPVTWYSVCFTSSRPPGDALPGASKQTQ